MAKRFVSTITEATAAAIQSVPTCKPLKLPVSIRVGDAVEALKTANRGACIVVDDTGRVYGMFTERDVLHHIDAGGDKWRTRLLREVTSPSTSVLRFGMTIEEALEEMNKGPFRRLPIVDAQCRPRGIVSIWDIMSHVAEHFPQRFLNLPPRPDRHGRNRWES